MVMKRLVVLFVFMLCGVNLYAQRSQTFNTCHFITKETVVKKENKLYDVKRGWRHEVSVGMLSFNNSDVYAEAVSVDYIFGNRITDNLFLGVGTGLDLTLSDTGTAEISTVNGFDGYFDDRDYINLPMKDFNIPLFANAKWYFAKRKVTPFASLSAGVNISGESTVVVDNVEYDYGGPRGFYDVAVGAAINCKGGRVFNLQIGYYSTILNTFQYNSGDIWKINQDTWYSGVNLSIGMTF